jgi:hypothetical protein
MENSPALELAECSNFRPKPPKLVVRKRPDIRCRQAKDLSDVKNLRYGYKARP